MTTTTQLPVPDRLHQARRFVLRNLSMKPNDVADRIGLDKDQLQAFYKVLQEYGLLDDVRQLTIDGAAYARLVEAYTPPDVIAMTPAYPKPAEKLPPEGEGPINPVKPWSFRRLWREVGDTEPRLRAAVDRLIERRLIKETESGLEILQ